MTSGAGEAGLVGMMGVANCEVHSGEFGGLKEARSLSRCEGSGELKSLRLMRSGGAAFCMKLGGGTL